MKQFHDDDEMREWLKDLEGLVKVRVYNLEERRGASPARLKRIQEDMFFNPVKLLVSIPGAGDQLPHFDSVGVLPEDPVNAGCTEASAWC
jgi:hypothetical protein